MSPQGSPSSWTTPRWTGCSRNCACPPLKDMWRPLADRAQREGWSHDRYLAELAEQELATT